ncbi:Hypothetical predicted protein [Octopus vulgaris]|uniref:Uncharacterized protein n=1 Tax=Octopus vulgaris TaxID=6645 RepID=A0AA36BFZ7_OCTVU|nr:Hypothetical predicted protein [Octopus vulgaris]
MVDGPEAPVLPATPMTRVGSTESLVHGRKNVRSHARFRHPVRETTQPGIERDGITIFRALHEEAEVLQR